MAWTARKGDDIKELNDSDAQVDEAAKQTADIIRSSKHLVFFTGAGLSTSAGIADFRGPDGVWTKAAKGEGAPSSKPFSTSIPTYSHRAIVKLLHDGVAKYVISQNVDGLHRKSGVWATQLSELHGNAFISVCAKCKREYPQDSEVLSEGDSHFTGFKCLAPGCDGLLQDNIIHFGEALPSDCLFSAVTQSILADVQIVLGSSLTVAPANDCPRITKGQPARALAITGEEIEQKVPGKLIIVNKQSTPLDPIADILVHASIDVFMQKVMAHLAVEVPSWKLIRRIAVGRDANNQPFAVGVDESGRAVDAIKSFEFLSFTEEVCVSFYGFYSEPGVTLAVPQERTSVFTYLISIDPLAERPVWEVNTLPEFESHVQEFIANTVPLPHLAHRERESQKMQAVSEQLSACADPLFPMPDMTGWHAVCPLATCTHAESLQAFSGLCVDTAAPCAEEGCGNIGENMLCLSCGAVRCGRHVQGHMIAHNTLTGHPLVVGFADLSFWCYPCESYISSSQANLAPWYRAFCIAKGFIHPTSKEAATAVDAPAPSPAPASSSSCSSSSSSSTASAVPDMSGWFAVEPLRTCPHTEALAHQFPTVTVDVSAPCVDCGNTGENMMCLICSSVRCGRHVKAHMMEHHAATQHPLVVGFEDLSFWCYPCENYIDSNNPHLRMWYRAFQLAKGFIHE